MPRILITGCSSGFGLAIAQRFLTEGWEVVATMRNTGQDVLPAHDRLTVLPVDVTDADSVAAAVAQAGPLDALVNNAGVGLLNVLEGATMENMRAVFETNTLGAIALMKAVMPQFRSRGAGTIVNVSSSVTVKPLPALAAYTASKAALNAFSESFALEAAQVGVRVRLVLPGSSPSTSFAPNAMARMGLEIPEPYEAFVMGYLGELRGAAEVTVPEDVAQAVWRAVTEPDTPMKTPAGADAVSWFKEAGLPAA
ncbi:SDR family NAD(P)-dependent oxidoreductase [Oricola sp.]|uniref:SDR family NAD(P)-dependent oxidoreductase n=1 Tax=Oricola sp. TaxID=1979950 RepID=UPI0025FD6EFF|nr:SDR family NAD(P)-dependent oxidoreductase [Oricola sp.]MCI5074386.1 SDR family NAD(P)-dependent oxidoreductase [Oricola sp.]